MRRVVLAGLLCACFAFGAVEGVVTNQTTGKPQPGATVILIELGSGMKTVGSVTTGGDGKFSFAESLQAASPYLLQAQYQGVNYNQMLPPGSSGTGIALDVFQTSATPRDAAVSQHMFLLEPSGTEMVVSERIVFTNQGKYTYQDPNGTIGFYVPSGISSTVQVRVQGPQGMPITRPAEPGKQPNTYVVRYPMKPGETNIDISYVLPMSGETAKFEGRILHNGGPVRFVAPSGVKIEGPFDESGPIPGTGATAYTLKGREFALAITGTGSLRAANNSSGESGEAGGDESGGIVARKPLIYEQIKVALPMMFGMLALGFVLLYRRPVPARSGAKR